jgi:hypothetical protein
MAVDANSSVYSTDSSFVPFGGACGNRQVITFASRGAVYATGSNIAACAADVTRLSAAVCGPGGAAFVDLGGNDIRHYAGNGTLPCPLVTPAQYSTFVFAGGIIPKATVTHTPNTCYLTITPIVSATTYPLCNSLFDQNYQILNISASPFATTTCATAPIITISDGVQSATITLTAAKNAWETGVDASSGLTSVFASGNTMTVKYVAGAVSACATPPTNLALSYALQSVLNP